METKILSTSEQDIREAAEIIAAGGLVAFPTETVYGLGANALDPVAVGKVYKARGRPSDNPMIVHISHKDDLRKLTDLMTRDMEILMDNCWPGPITMVVPATDMIPRVTTGGLDTVAVRMPSSEVARRLITESGVPIAAPSANLSGHPSPTTYQHCIDDLMGRVDAIVCGEDCQVGIESTVIDMTGDTPMILRPGILTKEKLSEILGMEVIPDPALLKKPEISKETGNPVADPDFRPKSPGMKYKHYAPKANVLLLKGTDEQYITYVNAHAADDVCALCCDEDLLLLRVKTLSLGRRTDYLTQAHHLFDCLRRIDENPTVHTVYSRLPSTEGVGLAVYNRLIRAAGFEVIDLEAV